MAAVSAERQVLVCPDTIPLFVNAHRAVRAACVDAGALHVRLSEHARRRDLPNGAEDLSHLTRRNLLLDLPLMAGLLADARLGV